MSIINPADVHSDAELGATKADFIAAIVQKYLVQGSMLANVGTDYSRLCGKGKQSVKLPNSDVFVPTNRVAGQAAPKQKITYGGDVLTPDHIPTVNAVFDWADDIQSVINNIEVAIENAALGHQRYYDAAVRTECLGAGIETGAANEAMSYDLLRLIRKDLKSVDGNFRGITLVMSAAHFDTYLGLNEVKAQDQYGPNQAIKEGVSARILGMDIIEDVDLADNEWFAVRNDGLGYGFWRGAKVKMAEALDFGTDSMQIVIDQMFGIKALQIEKAGAPATKSPLILRYNDGV